LSANGYWFSVSLLISTRQSPSKPYFITNHNLGGDAKPLVYSQGPVALNTLAQGFITRKNPFFFMSRKMRAFQQETTD
jgi:hypothetical protein